MSKFLYIVGLPSKSITGLKNLPEEAGVYYVTAFWIVLYIGKTKNLRKRWKTTHHRYEQFKLLHPFGRLHYQVLKIDQLQSYEKAAIKQLRPSWNRTPIPSFWDLLKLCLAVWGRAIFYILLLLIAIAAVIYLLMQS